MVLSGICLVCFPASARDDRTDQLGGWFEAKVHSDREGTQTDCCEYLVLASTGNSTGRDLLFLPGVDASHVYVRAWVLGCFQSYQYPNLSEGADRASGQLRGDKERPFSGVTKSGRVWRKVLESDAQSVCQVLSQACG